jgi:hypothetical protein
MYLVGFHCLLCNDKTVTCLHTFPLKNSDLWSKFGSQRLWKLVKNYRRMTVQYGGYCTSQRKFTNVCEDWQEGRHTIVDARSGPPSAVTCVEIKKQISQRIRRSHRIGTDETASETSISHGKIRCKNGLRSDVKHCILKESENLWIVRSGALKRTIT